LQAAYPYVQWVDYMNALLPEGLSVAEDEMINLSVPSFFEDLGKLLAKTPKRVIANYMFWRIHGFSVGFLTEEFRKRQLQYATALSGRQEQEARWKECVDIATGRLVGVTTAPPQGQGHRGLPVSRISCHVSLPCFCIFF